MALFNTTFVQTGEDKGNQDYTYCIESGLSGESGNRSGYPTCIFDRRLAVVAGSDTSSTALAHLCYFMVKHPQCRKKLLAEIHDFFPNGQDSFDPSKQVEMPYLNACM